MATILVNELENEIDNTLALSAICRGEWCRAIESKVDVLEDELIGVRTSEPWVDADKINGMSNKIVQSYKNLGGDFRL
jgi:hypothetical protein